MLLVNPETWDSFRSHVFRSKLALCIVVWLATRQQGPHLALPSAITSSVTPTSAAIPVPLHESVTSAVPAFSMAKGFPHTAPYSRGQPAPNPAQEEKDEMPVKESTTNGSTARHSTTPPLSDPPPPPLRSSGASARLSEVAETAKSAQSEPGGETRDGANPSQLGTSDCPIDYRGRPLCPDTTRIPLSLRNRSSELADATSEFGWWFLSTLSALFLSILRIRLSPYFLFVGVLHSLLAIQFLALVTEDQIIRIGLSNPLPPDFAKGSTLGKRFERLKWRAKATLTRYGRPIGVFAILVAAAIFIGQETWNGERGGAGFDVPFWRLLLPNEPVLRISSSKPFRLYRTLTFLETLATLLTLVQPSKHLIPASLLPQSMLAPSFLFPREAPSPSPDSDRIGTPHSPHPARHMASGLSIYLETTWLLSILVDVSLSLISIVQITLLIPSMPLTPFALAPHFIFHTLRGRAFHIRSLRKNMLRTYGCLTTVFSSFPNREAEFGETEGDWVCTICFEGAAEGHESTPGKGSTTQGRCSLPCGHHYHAGCLVHWFTFQSWCPVCHAPVVPLEPPQPPRVNHDIYPGNVRRRRAAG